MWWGVVEHFSSVKFSYKIDFKSYNSGITIESYNRVIHSCLFAIRNSHMFLDFDREGSVLGSNLVLLASELDARLVAIAAEESIL